MGSMRLTDSPSSRTPPSFTLQNPPVLPPDNHALYVLDYQ
jgi:hypothetical protein